MSDPTEHQPIVDNAVVDNAVVTWLDRHTDAPSVYEPHHHAKIWAVVLAFAFFLLDMVLMRGNPRSESLVIILGGSMIAQIALLTTWLALGNWTLLARLMVSGLIVAFTLLAGIDPDRGGGPFTARTVKMVCTPLLWMYAAAAPIGFLKLLGFRLQLPARHRNSIESTSMQFSLLQIFGWTAAAAFVALVARGVEFRFGEIWYILGSIIVFDVMLLATIWAMLGRAVGLRWLLPAGLLFCLLIFIMSMAGANDSGMFFFGLLVSFAVTTGVLLIYRRIGYRLYRLRGPKSEVAATHALD